MKRAADLFLGFWVALFILSFVTAKGEIAIYQRRLYTAVLCKMHRF